MKILTKIRSFLGMPSIKIHKAKVVKEEYPLYVFTDEDTMWRHFCHRQESVISVEKGWECNWCGKEEDSEALYQGLFYAYPLQRFLRWPEYMEYYYWLDKKSS